MLPIKKELAKLLKEALRQGPGDPLSAEELESSFEIPREEKFGDLTTPIVLKLAKEKKCAFHHTPQDLKTA